MTTKFGSGFEGLEERTLLAANVTAVLTANGTLTVTGDVTNQSIYLYGDGDSGEVTLDVNGQTLRVNGLDNAVSDDDHFFTGVKNVNVNTNGGADQVTIADLSITGNLTTNLGAGDNDFAVLVAYGHHFNVGGNVTVNGGAGEHDFVQIHSFNNYGYGVTIGGKANLTVGNYGRAEIATNWYGGDVVVGNNVLINVNSTDGGSGSGLIRTQGDGDIRIVGVVTLNGGLGGDRLEVEARSEGSLEIGGRVILNGNGGNDEMGLAAYGYAREFDSSYYGYGDDSSRLTGRLTTGAVTLNGGDGNDAMHLTAWSLAYGLAGAFYGNYASAVADSQVEITTGNVVMNGGSGEDQMQIAAFSQSLAYSRTRGIYSTAYGIAESSASINTGTVNLNGNNGNDSIAVYAFSYEDSDTNFSRYDYGYGNNRLNVVPFAMSNYYGSHAYAYGSAEINTGALTLNGGAGSDSGDDRLQVSSIGTRSEISVSGAADLLGGFGIDELTMTASGNLYMYGNYNNYGSSNVIDISGQLKLDGGAGGDDMSLVANDMTKKNDVRLGDQMRFYGSKNQSVLSAGSLMVLGAAGDDSFEAYGITIDFNASVSMGTQNDKVRLWENSVGGTLLLNGGPGNNSLLEYANNVGISTTKLNFVIL